MLQLLEDDDFGISEEDDSNFEGEGVESYLPRADPELLSCGKLRGNGGR